MTPEQCRTARRLLGWSQDRLGAVSGTGGHVVSTFERSGRVQPAAEITSTVDRLAAIRAALIEAGIEFVDGEPGAMIRTSTVASDRRLMTPARP